MGQWVEELAAKLDNLDLSSILVEEKTRLPQVVSFPHVMCTRGTVTHTQFPMLLHTGSP